jgi:hypothetical protein
MAAGDELARVGEPGLPFFRLRPGEEGVSVFDMESVEPPLTEDEILAGFRPGSSLVIRSGEVVVTAGLQVVGTPGAESLPTRLKVAHSEIRPGPGMTRRQFKDALRSLE